VVVVDTVADSEPVMSTDEEERIERRSILLKGRGFVGLDGPAAVDVCADAETLAIPFFMAPTAALPAAEAFVLRFFAVVFRLERVLEEASVGLTGAAATAAAQV